MDAGTMIDEANFADVVCRIMGGAVTPYGYELANAGGFRVRFEKPRSYVAVTYDASRSHEVSIRLGELPEDAEPPLELADVLRSTHCGVEDVGFAELIQTSEVEALSRLLERASQLLVEFAPQLLDGQPDAFVAARALRSERAAAYTAELRNTAVLEDADSAWDRKEYGRVHDLLNPIKDALDELHRRRLEFAERRL